MKRPDGRFCGFCGAAADAMAVGFTSCQLGAMATGEICDGGGCDLGKFIMSFTRTCLNCLAAGEKWSDKRCLHSSFDMTVLNRIYEMMLK